MGCPLLFKCVNKQKINMPITENNFTAAELSAAVTANPALAAELKTFGSTAGYAIRDTEEEKTFLGNYEKQVAGKITSDFANNIEKDVATIWGQPKKENEKYHDYLKRVITEAKTGMDTTKQELDALKASSTGTPADKDRIKQLEDLLTTQKNEFTSEKEKLSGELNQTKVTGELGKSLGKLQARYQKGIAPELAATFEATVVADVAKRTRFVDGKYVIVDPADNTKVLIDPVTYANKTLDQELEEKLGPILEKGQAGAGAGQQQQSQQQQSGADAQGVVKDADGKVTDITILPADVKTQVQLADFMKKHAVAQGTIEFNKIWEKLGKNLPLR